MKNKEEIIGGRQGHQSYALLLKGNGPIKLLMLREREREREKEREREREREKERERERERERAWCSGLYLF